MKTLTIENLIYEELILLQEILIQVDESEYICIEDRVIFESLFEKVINS